MSMFGKEFEQIWPKAGSQLKLSEFGRKLLKQCETIKKPDSKEVYETQLSKSLMLPNNLINISTDKNKLWTDYSQMCTAFLLIYI